MSAHFEVQDFFLPQLLNFCSPVGGEYDRKDIWGKYMKKVKRKRKKRIKRKKEKWIKEDCCISLTCVWVSRGVRERRV
jgi:hypothetical protein